MIKALLVGDYSERVIAHLAIPKALALAAEKLSLSVQPEWLETNAIESASAIASKKPDAIWCVPGSPYNRMEGALTAIRFARENNIPFLGTCGGFQHALIEYARNVLGIADADHSESSPEAKTPLIAKLQCALVNQTETVRIDPNTLLAQIYEASTATEGYQCSYGLNPEFQKRLEDGHLRFSAFSDGLGVRAFELPDHRFFIGTLFQPERSASSGRAHPLIQALLAASAANSG